jgi:hypothetical protein
MKYVDFWMAEELLNSQEGLSSMDLMVVDPCIIVKFIKKNPTRCNSVSKFYYFIFI